MAAEGICNDQEQLTWVLGHANACGEANVGIYT